MLENFLCLNISKNRELLDQYDYGIEIIHANILALIIFQ